MFQRGDWFSPLGVWRHSIECLRQLGWLLWSKKTNRTFPKQSFKSQC